MTHLPRLVTLAAAATVALAAPAGASAAVEITPTTIAVTAPGGARVEIDRAPFALTFLDPHGRVVLREAPASAPLAPIAPVPQIEFGQTAPALPTLYGPLSFIVGTQLILQAPLSQWEGDLQSVTTGGIAYHADRVLSAVARAGGVDLVLSSTDPSGRRLSVEITPDHGVLRVSAAPDPAAGVAAMADSFTSDRGEAFHGFGGRHDATDERGHEFYNWLQQENVSAGDAGGLTSPIAGDTYLFPNGRSAAYYVQSAFVSSHGYGFLLDESAISHWRMASDSPSRWQTEVGAAHLAYDVVPTGGVTTATQQLNGILGRQPAPPAWALGTQFDREVRYPSDPQAQYLGEVESDIANFDRYRLHVDGYRIEGWAELSPAQLRGVISELRARHIHPLVYFRPFVGTDTTGTDDPSLYQYAIDHGYVATHADGSPYTFVANFNAPTVLIDFTNPAAVHWWQGRIRAALDLGADGFMQDFGEQVLTDMHFHDGETGVTMHNRYPLLYDAATRTELDAYLHGHPARKLYFYTRSGYSGTPGNSAFENANFPGDETTDWTRSSGIASLATDMLNRAVGGAFGFTTDIGGYFDIGPYHATSKELFIRWAELTALTPFYRLHGSILSGVHTPWSYDAETVQIYEAMAALHARLAPLIRRLWKTADRTGVPVTRPLWLAYPSDPTAATQDQEWMLGPDVLAAPVVVQGATERAAYLPAGCWRYLGRGARMAGGRTVDVPAPLSTAVYFVRCGKRL